MASWMAQMTPAESVEMWQHFFTSGDNFYGRRRLSPKQRQAHVNWVPPYIRRDLVPHTALAPDEPETDLSYLRVPEGVDPRAKRKQTDDE